MTYLCPACDAEVLLVANAVVTAIVTEQDHQVFTVTCLCPECDQATTLYTDWQTQLRVSGHLLAISLPDRHELRARFDDIIAEAW